MYGTHRILPERWTFDFREEAGGSKSELGKRTRKKSGKHIPCAECGESFQLWHRSDRAVYCSPSCNHTAKRRITDERAKCLACHALAGMTNAASGKMVAVGGAVISLERKNRGIQGGSYKLAAKVSHMKREARDRPFKAKEEAIEQWVSDEWGSIVECYWTSMQTADIDRITLMGDGVDVSNIGINMLKYYLNHSESKTNGAARSLARYHAAKGDEVFIIKKKLRNHIKRVCRLSGMNKQRKTIEYLGCTIPEARAHLQKQFKRGMGWENHGDVWEIDHIIPMSHFDLMDESQRMRVNHFTNLQPLFKAENRMKGNRLMKNHQLALF